MLCREEAAVREKAGELGLLEQSGKAPTALFAKPGHTRQPARS